VVYEVSKRVRIFSASISWTLTGDLTVRNANVPLSTSLRVCNHLLRVVDQRLITVRIGPISLATNIFPHADQ